MTTTAQQPLDKPASKESIAETQKAKEIQQQIPIDLTPLPQFKGAQLLTELQQRAAKRWDEIKAIESEQNGTRIEAVDQWDKEHGIDRTKTLPLIPATIGHYGGVYVDLMPEQIEVLKPIFGNLWPKRKTNNNLGIYFAHRSKGLQLLEALDGIIYKQDYPEYWD